MNRDDVKVGENYMVEVTKLSRVRIDTIERRTELGKDNRNMRKAIYLATDLDSGEKLKFYSHRKFIVKLQ